MDLKDRRLIAELDFNSRISLSELGKKLRLSKQVVKYRIENLVKNNIITGFYTDINSSKLGYEIFLVYLKFNNLIKEDFTKYVSKQKNIGVNASINGTWDYCIGIWAKNSIHFKQIYQDIMKDYEKFVKSKTIMIETDFYYYKPNQIIETTNEIQTQMSQDLEVFNLNQIDQDILEELSKNSRVSLVELSKKIKLTPNAINKRIKRLEKENIILSYRVMINYQKLGFLHHRIFLHLENLTKKKRKEIITFLGSLKQIISITETIGFCDLEFRSITKDINEFYLMMELIKKQFSDDIKEYNSLIYFKFHDTLNYFPIKN